MSHTITGLTNGTAYLVQVIATRTDANDGQPSAEVTTGRRRCRPERASSRCCRRR